MTLHTDEPAERTPLELSLAEAKELLQRAVAEKGADYQYTPTSEGHCAYFDPETKAPSCIVGHVLAYKGVTEADLEVTGSNLKSDVNELIYQRHLLVDVETSTLLEIAQSEQDQSTSWGDAVAEALATYEEATTFKLRPYDDDEGEAPF